MVSYDRRDVTLTSGSGGATATATTTSIVGELAEIVIENSTTAQPDNDWDLTVYQGTSGGNDYKVLFYDATVAQTNTAAVVYKPVAVAAKAADGTASTLTELHPVSFGPLTVTGANMGSSKVAVVKLIFKVA